MTKVTSGLSRSVRPIAIGVVVLGLALSGCAAKKAAPTATTAPSASVSAPAPSGSAAPASTPATASTPASGASAAASIASAVGAGLKGDPAAITLVTSALSGLSSVKSVNITGTVTDTGQTVSFGLQLASGGGATGNLMFEGGTVKLIILPTAVYLNADQKVLAAITQLGGAAASAETQQFAQYAGKWVELLDLTKLPATGTNPLGKVDKYSSLSGLSNALKSASGTVTLADKKTIDGQSAQGVSISDATAGGSGAIVYFQTGGSHLPLEVVPAATAGAGGPTGVVNFTDYNKPVSISAPAGAINLSPMVMGLLGGALGGANGLNFSGLPTPST